MQMPPLKLGEASLIKERLKILIGISLPKDEATSRRGEAGLR